MLSLLTRYEIEMAHQHHARSTSGDRLTRPGRLQLALVLAVLLLGATASASQLIHR